MDKFLSQFNGDMHTKEALIEFFHQFIDSEALKKVYAGEDTAPMKEAREIIDNGFEYLKDLYAVPTKQKENTNEAR